ncbi:MAG: undecaprenyl/decaprenyl-phosphate alpha-N-acetylglucosaminyl 1-phosphate transferase [Actinobacteria bacterium]|uniref:Undecaprenyl/decaprenyl-phosphate alpha-N-acetylglucosaminyl 1-phosphate transferase n=1 Tax=Candidatus Fonsibacter lacus TaxID=2576439 RepID=A0A965GDQ9_9PROT|nr:undecaprenyl/decaprenyl-phosphate alpha-N-acetylglucosaminyl 1-phosphate transferase [Candidatus Fonsibacter lacus]
MREHLLILLFSGVFVYLLTPYARVLALKFGAVAKVRDRDVHTEVTPRWGGTAIWLGIMLAILISSQLNLLSKAFQQDEQIRGICIATTIICVLGILDDKWGVDAITKLAGQILAAAVLVNFGVQLLWLPINGVTMLPTSLGQLITILIIVVTINAVNFIDGLDGLASGIVAIAAGCFFAFAYLLSVVYNFDRAGAPSLITAIMVGACLGFLPHNSYPAKIFMGDSGSMLLGLLLGVAAITLTGQIDANAIASQNFAPTLVPLLLPFAVLAIPSIDLLLAVIRRTRAGRSPFAPDMEHLHHRLLRRGHTHQSATVALYLWTALIAIPVSASAFIDWRLSLFVPFIIAIPTLTFTLYRWPFGKHLMTSQSER